MTNLSIDTLFNIKEKTFEDMIINAQIEINSSHVIFEGHFPNNPIVPGVCMIKIVGEVLAQNFNKKMLLSEVKGVKFLNIVNPQITNILTIFINIVDQSDDSISVKSEIYDETKKYLKFNGKYNTQ